ncbi:lipoprotein releasing system, transmembrane protein, LolC/E family [Ruegeria denitrificans]|uniref:Lipoprotein releasing system, transmembrane protein, LolC/E family n=1 Tax=Ruegeria denitrificans TaxID=1715692 RepID=A0A0N7M9N3_9RHOB|nr:FtsX-like permease family protein [Ruegeria denitrificans]CUK01497.1 lipoprotein releasing system, transmembrane protein, LolC/E family [Ruegeria denitrificans]
MSLRLAGRLARRELRGGVRGFRVFLACLALGVAAIAAVGSVRQAIQTGLTQEGAALLGGDAQLEFTYRFANEAERAWMEQTATAVSEVVDFRSMALVQQGEDTQRALTQVKSVDATYPLVGTPVLDPDQSLPTALDGAQDLPGAVMDPVLMDRLGLSVGDRFALGTQKFVLTAALIHEPDGAADGFGLGPRTLVRTEDLQASGLLAPGTLFSTKYRLTLPPGTDLATVSDTAGQNFDGNGMRWTDARNGAPGIAEFVARLSAFLVLVGLSGLAVGGIGVSAAVRAYLGQKTETIATLRTLGADRATIFQTYMIQIGILSGIGILLGIVLGGLLPLLLTPLIEARLPVPAVFSLYTHPLAEAALYGVLTAFLFTLWPLARTEEVRAATLFRDALSSARALPRVGFILATGIGLALLVASASWFSGSARLTLWTAAGLVGALLLLSLSALAIRKLARIGTAPARGRPTLRWALSAISDPREGAASVVLSLGLGLSVLAAVGQIDGTLRNAIAGNLPDVAPSYFFVDIQKDQMPGFTERLESDPAVTRIESAPMLRGIITQINGRPAREVAGDHWVLDGDRGVTYSAAPPQNTRVTAGEWWPESYSGTPQVSFAAEEAEEMGLSLGDEVTVNILGRDITAEITSFREVDFSTAGIGFIMAMNPSALAGAPHSFIATVYAEEQAEAAILRDLAGQYPNITAIRVRDAIDRVSGLLAGLAAATSYGAGVSLLTGFLVLIGAAAAGETARRYESAILKTLGANRRRILFSFALRSILLGAAAGVVALLTGILGGWAVATYIFDTGFTVIWTSALGIVLAGILVTLGAGLVFALRPLAVRPARILRATD